MIASSPFDCTTNDKKECIRGENAPRTSLFFTIGPIVLIFLCLLAVLGTFTCYIYTAEKQLQPRDTPKDLVKRNTVRHRMIQNRTDPSRKRILSNLLRQESSGNDNDAAAIAIENKEKKEEGKVTKSKEEIPLRNSGTADPSSQNASSRVVIHQGMDLTKQAAQQSILYILAFMLVYSGPLLALILRFSKTKDVQLMTFNFWIVSLFYPVGGLLNMLIYTRPKVKALKKLLPQIPIPICLMIIILSGGEVPDLRLLQDDPVVSRGPISSKKPQQDDQVDQVASAEISAIHTSEVDRASFLRNRNPESVNSLARWINAFGYEISSGDFDLDEELDKIMHGLEFNEDEDEGDHISSQCMSRIEEEEVGTAKDKLSESRINLEIADVVFFEGAAGKQDPHDKSESLESY